MKETTETTLTGQVETTISIPSDALDHCGDCRYLDQDEPFCNLFGPELEDGDKRDRGYKRCAKCLATFIA